MILYYLWVVLPEKITRSYMVLLGHILIKQSFDFTGLDKITKHNPITREDQPLWSYWTYNNYTVLIGLISCFWMYHLTRDQLIYGPNKTYNYTRD